MSPQVGHYIQLYTGDDDAIDACKTLQAVHQGSNKRMQLFRPTLTYLAGLPMHNSVHDGSWHLAATYAFFSKQKTLTLHEFATNCMARNKICLSAV